MPSSLRSSHHPPSLPPNPPCRINIQFVAVKIIVFNDKAIGNSNKKMSSIGSGEGGEGGGEWNISAPSQKILDATQKRRVALNALNKLLEQQRCDLQQTHDLLASLDDVGGDSVDGENEDVELMIGEYNEEPSASLTAMQRELQSQLRALTLNSTAIWERERDRGPVIAPYVIKVPYYALCYLLDVVFEGRNAFSRFFLLETVARMLTAP